MEIILKVSFYKTILNLHLIFLLEQQKSHVDDKNIFFISKINQAVGIFSSLWNMFSCVK